MENLEYYIKKLKTDTNLLLIEFENKIQNLPESSINEFKELYVNKIHQKTNEYFPITYFILN